MVFVIQAVGGVEGQSCATVGLYSGGRGLDGNGLGPLVLGQVLRLVLVPDLAADSGCLGLLGLYSGGRGLDGSGLGPLVLGQVLRLVPLLGVDSDGLGQRGLISGLGLQRLTAGLLDRI